MLKTIIYFFTKNKTEVMQQQKNVNVAITSYSQPHVLQHRMREERLTHGETVTADLYPVRLEESYGKMIMYFCPLQSVGVIKRQQPGDGGSLPEEATVHGIKALATLKPGLYTLKNVTLFSNGTLQVIANDNTFFEDYQIQEWERAQRSREQLCCNLPY